MAWHYTTGQAQYQESRERGVSQEIPQGLSLLAPPPAHQTTSLSEFTYTVIIIAPSVVRAWSTPSTQNSRLL